MMHSELSIPSGLLVTAGLSPHFVAQFALFVGIIIAWTIVWGKILKKLFNLPIIAGRIIAGILLGPSLVNIAQYSFFAQPLQLVDQVTHHVYSLASYDVMLFVVLLISASLTVSYLLWIAGHETDVNDIIAIGPIAVVAGVLGALLPIIMIALPLYYSGWGWSAVQSIGMGLIFAATSVSIPVAMLFDYNKMHLKSSKAALGAAVVDDIFAVILLSIFSLGIQAGLLGDSASLVEEESASIHWALLSIMGAFIGMGIFGYYILRPLVETLKKTHLSYLIAPVASIIMLFYFAFAELIGGLAGITGAYFAGFFHRMGDHRHTAEKVISPFVNTFLLPLFLGSIGLQLNVQLLNGNDWVLVIFLLLIAIVSKLLGCWLATTLSNAVSHKDSYQWTGLDTYLFGSSMIARGEVGLVVSTILFTAGIISQNHYIIAVVTIILTTVATPIMLAQGFERIVLQDTEGIYSLTLGRFAFIGTTQMFHIIMGYLDRSGIDHTVVQMGDGSIVTNADSIDVKIILNENNGIVFEGNREKIEAIVKMVKESIIEEIA